jgi:hypothetical protein
MPLRRKHAIQPCRLALALRLFQRDIGREEIIDESAADEEDEKPDFGRVRCPLCHWRPRASSRWFCADCGHPEYFYGGCGTAWNTFETRGLCPGCKHQWRWTACLSCAGWSAHEEWYERGEQ